MVAEIVLEFVEETGVTDILEEDKVVDVENAVSVGDQTVVVSDILELEDNGGVGVVKLNELVELLLTSDDELDVESSLESDEVAGELETEGSGVVASVLDSVEDETEGSEESVSERVTRRDRDIDLEEDKSAPPELELASIILGVNGGTNEDERDNENAVEATSPVSDNDMEVGDLVEDVIRNSELHIEELISEEEAAVHDVVLNGASVGESESRACDELSMSKVGAGVAVDGSGSWST
ncbi:hypothetical protein NLJ89_g336 [Agrocybe chaxingu]|uniref:Uncharacterized protein n=1 Tax=Agrocybe chaxingu TaxID=84603 RepID=A0A9W8TGK4_9AGAR|nr:hypothetical protein NLJ89_g336 [Agrocybe chaxingu]